MNRRELFAVAAASLAARKLPAVKAPAYRLFDSTVLRSSRPRVLFFAAGTYRFKAGGIIETDPGTPLPVLLDV
jgi:hypothetical protein